MTYSRSRFEVSVANVEQLERVNAAGSVAVSFEPAMTKSSHLLLGGAKSETMCVWSTRSGSGFRSRPRIHEDKVTIRFVSSGAMSRGNLLGGETLAMFGQAIFAPFGEMSLADTTPKFSSLSASINYDALVKKGRALSGDGLAEISGFDQIVDAHIPRLQSLRSTLELLRCHLLVPDDGLDKFTPLLEEMLAYQVLFAWPATRKEHGDRAAPIGNMPVKIAIDYIESSLARTIEVADIAAAAGISVRSLQIIFKRHFGCSPFYFLISRRLDKVRAELTGDTTLSIMQIARKWGFVHMSDFSKRYRERFGELPSDTRMKAR